jgi:beta-lactamase class D
MMRGRETLVVTMRTLLVLALLAACGNKRAPARDAAPPVVVADAAPAPTTRLPALDFAKTPFATNGCFVIRDLATGDERVSDAARCAEPHRPYSTFKVPNALIGVELGILDGPDAAMEWDRKKHPPKDWWMEDWKQDQTLRTAMKISAVPVFQNLALQIGRERMQRALDDLRYGNRDIGDDKMLDHFWLDGPIRISAREQVEFMAALAEGKLPVSAKAQETVREVILRDERGDWKVYAKTGSGPKEDATGALVWLVGWLERGTDRWAFAAWLTSPESVTAARTQRDAAIEDMWRALGLPPKP